MGASGALRARKRGPSGTVPTVPTVRPIGCIVPGHLPCRSMVGMVQTGPGTVPRNGRNGL
jgi:hypothetical protein